MQGGSNILHRWLHCANGKEEMNVPKMYRCSWVTRQCNKIKFFIRGGLIKPTESVEIICREVEKCFQQMLAVNDGIYIFGTNSQPTPYKSVFFFCTKIGNHSDLRFTKVIP